MTRYIEIYEDIRKKITDNIYEFGSKLPSKRVTAENYGVSVITVEHAYELLMEEGYAVSREKSGYFVSYRENEYFSDGNYTSRRVHAPTPVKSSPGGKPRNPGLYGVFPGSSVSAPGTRADLGSRGKTPPKDSEEISFNIYAKTVRRVLSDYASPKTICLASFLSMALVLPAFFDIWKWTPAVTMRSKGYAKEK